MNIIIAGDFNIDILLDSKESRLFKDILDSFGVRTTIHEPTRIANDSATCIDNVITNIDNVTASVVQTHLSDHLAQIFSFNSASPKFAPEKITTRIINANSLEVFIRALASEDWSNINFKNHEEVNEKWLEFSETFNRHFNSCFPTVQTTTRAKSGCSFKPPPDVIALKDQVNLLFTMSHFNPAFLDTYKKIKKKYEHALSLAKQSSLTKKIVNSSNKSRTTWQIIKDLSGSNKKENLYNMDGDPTTIADDFNSFFVNISETISQQLVKNSNGINGNIIGNIVRNERSFFMFEITENEVVSAVKSLKNKKSCGHDEVPMNVVKECIHQIKKPITILINQSFKEGVFPDDLKVSIVKPLHKKGNTKQFNNYRPISLLTSFSKIFEKILSNRIMNFLKKFKILSTCQHGFIHKRSTETAIFELTQRVLSFLEEGEIPVGVFLDLSKAFDCVDHKLLLHKLNMYGIRDKQLRLLDSYLTNRKQRVLISVNGKTFKSKEANIRMGVPQGSILGPLLFVLYINDLPATSPSQYLMYADDTNLTMSVKNPLSITNMIEESIDRTARWCTENMLLLNEHKTECIIFSTDKSKRAYPKDITGSNYNITVGKSVRFLGVTVDNNLKWYNHIEELNNKLKSVIYSMNVLKKHVNLDVLKIIYFSNFQSLLSYGIIFWGNSQHVNRVFVIQKLVLRIMMGMGYRESCRGMFKANNILTVHGLYIFRILLFIKKNPHYFDKFKSNNNTRNTVTYFYPNHNLTMTERGALYMGMKLFNSLPRNLRSTDHHENFKKELYRVLIKWEPYTVEEFIESCTNQNGS